LANEIKNEVKLTFTLFVTKSFLGMNIELSMASTKPHFTNPQQGRLSSFRELNHSIFTTHKNHCTNFRLIYRSQVFFVTFIDIRFMYNGYCTEKLLLLKNEHKNPRIEQKFTGSSRQPRLFQRAQFQQLFSIPTLLQFDLAS